LEVSDIISIFASVTKILLMGFFDKKPKKDSGLFGSKYSPKQEQMVFEVG
jgi:hypothetical protein